MIKLTTWLLKLTLVVLIPLNSALAQTVSFKDVHRDFPVGKSPQSIRTADFNGDGIADLVTANSVSNDVSVLLGKGDGTFGAPISSPAGQNPAAVATADFNRDGKVDLVVLDFNRNKVSVLLGHGDGTFASPVSYSVGTGPIAIITADFNNDGKPDLAVLNSTSNNVSILLGKANGTFQAGKDTPFAGLGPIGLAVGLKLQPVSTTDANKETDMSRINPQKVARIKWS
jgi:FG-GAP-like repeat